MNIARLLPQKMLHKTIEKRRLNRIQEYTSVADSLEPKFAQKINENIDSIARYAQRKNCHLEFVPAEDLFQNSMQLNVYKKGVSLLIGQDGLPAAAFDFKTLSGKSILPDDAKGADLIGHIRKTVKSIIDNDKDWINKIVEM